MNKMRYNRGTPEFNYATNVLLEIEDDMDILEGKGFDGTFVMSVVDFMSARDYLTDKQYDAVINIADKWLGSLNAR